MDRLTEIRTKIECYQHFLEDLDEITSALETNTGLGLFLQAESQYAIDNPEIELLLNSHEALRWIKRDSHREDYINILLALWARANAKMGEIAFILENSIDYLQNEEDEILHAMECHEASTHFEDYMNEPTEQSANRQKGADNE